MFSSEDYGLQLSNTGLNILVTFLIIFIFYIYSCYVVWEQEFGGGTRLQRTNEQSPSYGNPPVPVSFETEKDMVTLRASAWDHTEISEYTTEVPIQHSGQSKLNTPGARTRSFSPQTYGSINLNSTSTTSKSVPRYSILPQGMHNSQELDMDHQYVPFRSYVWAATFIGLNAFSLWSTGVTILKFRSILQNINWLQPKLYIPEELAAKLILESTLAVHYIGKRKGENDAVIGGFSFPDFPFVEQDGTVAVAELLSIEIDLTKKRFIKGKIDDRDLTADETIILVWYYTISANHVKLHALSNWAINLDPKQVEQNPFPAQNSLVTTIYNYFGYSVFTTFFSAWQSIGVLSKDWHPDSFLNTINTGIENGFFAHPLVKELSPYSEFVDFHVKLRPIFLAKFDKVKRRYFPGCHGEAMFVGTVMHSLDHTRMDWNLEDPLWLDTSHPEFGKMAEMGRVVKVGFVKDLPGLLFHKRYKGSKHPFYESIYEEAVKINKALADNMDTCIVK